MRIRLKQKVRQAMIGRICQRTWLDHWRVQLKTTLYSSMIEHKM